LFAATAADDKSLLKITSNSSWLKEFKRKTGVKCSKSYISNTSLASPNGKEEQDDETMAENGIKYDSEYENDGRNVKKLEFEGRKG